VNRRQFLRMGLLGALGALAGGSAYAAWLEPRWPEVVGWDVPISRLSPALDGLIIAQLSDLHVGPHAGPGHVRRAVALLNGLKPDLVALTGDYVLHSADYGIPCAEALALLDAPLGAYGVLGNHDIWEGAEQVADALSAHGIRLLRQGAHVVSRGGARLWLVGVDDAGYTAMSSMAGGAGEAGQRGFARHWQGARDALVSLLADIPAAEPRIVLAHNPDLAEMLARADVDLLLAGHTHGGQVRLPLLGPPVVPSAFGPKYAAGWAQNSPVRTYVNRGLGTITPAVRLNCRPEITLFRLCCKR